MFLESTRTNCFGYFITIGKNKINLRPGIIEICDFQEGFNKFSQVTKLNRKVLT